MKYHLPKYSLLFVMVTMIFGLTFLSGCAKNLPDGMPKLMPVTLTIVQDGKPLPNAMVTLYPDSEADQKWSGFGTTDASGIVQVRVMGKYDGAIAGKHKVTVSCVQKDESTRKEIKNSTGGVENIVYDEYQLVNAKLHNLKTTTLEIDIVDGKNVQTVDCGAPVRVLIKNEFEGKMI